MRLHTVHITDKVGARGRGTNMLTTSSARTPTISDSRSRQFLTASSELPRFYTLLMTHAAPPAT